MICDLEWEVQWYFELKRGFEGFWNWWESSKSWSLVQITGCGDKSEGFGPFSWPQRLFLRSKFIIFKRSSSRRRLFSILGLNFWWFLITTFIFRSTYFLDFFLSVDHPLPTPPYHSHFLQNQDQDHTHFFIHFALIFSLFIYQRQPFQSQNPLTPPL